MAGKKKKNSRRIMIVDDNPDVVETLRAIMESEGHVVETAGTADECIKKIKDKKGKGLPALMLLDIMMPGMGVKELLSRFNKDKKAAKIKIIYLTAVAASEKERKGYIAAGNVVDYITKPFYLEDLVKRVNNALEEK